MKVLHEKSFETEEKLTQEWPIEHDNPAKDFWSLSFQAYDRLDQNFALLRSLYWWREKWVFAWLQICLTKFALFLWTGHKTCG